MGMPHRKGVCIVYAISSFLRILLCSVALVVLCSGLGPGLLVCCIVSFKVTTFIFVSASFDCGVVLWFAVCCILKLTLSTLIHVPVSRGKF